MKRAWNVERLVRLACILALVGLALMVWSVLSPRPIPVILAMSLGQAFGTGALATYLLAIVLELREAGLLGRRGPAGTEPAPEQQPPPPGNPPAS